MIRVGDFAETTRTLTAADIAALAMFGGAPGAAPLIGAMFSALLGTRLPGPGTNYLKQEMRFHAGAPRDTLLTARVEVTRLRPQTRLIDLATTCHLPDGTLLCEGRALVLARDVAGAWD